jgi:superfamily II DNA or RNA helicase
MIGISDFIPNYPLINNEEFNMNIVRKKEFYELHSDVEQKKIKDPIYWNHQKLIQRFLSPFTPYMELLLFGKPGTGKTCASVSVSEMNKLDPLLRKPILIIVPNDTLMSQWKTEIALKCTTGEYIPENYFSVDPIDRLTNLEKVIRMGKLLAPIYHITTIEKMRRNIDSLSDEAIQKKYSNTLIIVDEAHNLRIQTNTTKETIEDSRGRYNAFHRFFHVIENRKILLLTGTPIIDRGNELAGIMNLILPIDKQMPTGVAFTKKFLQRVDDLDTTIIHKNLLLDYMKGRVSFIKEGGEFPVRIDEGTNRYTKYIKTVNLEMSDIQIEGCKQAYAMDTKKEKSKSTGLWRNSRQALNFVYKHEDTYLWGMDASKLLMVKTYKNIKIENKIIKVAVYSIRKEFREEIKQNLQHYSIKYYSLVKLLKKYPNQCMYLFNPLVSGAGGANFLGAILELFDFGRFINKSITNRKLYAIITGEDQSIRQRQQVFSVMNSVENQNADIIQLLIGTKSIAEGNNLTNVRTEIVISPYWNNSVTEQSIGRGIRPSSLLFLPKEERTVKVLQYCATSSSTTSTSTLPIKENMDIHLYRLSERKDIVIKKLERVMKESAWDCALNYKRNVNIQDENFSRNCDYENCNYKCQGFDPTVVFGKYRYTIPEDEVDYSTYLLYFSEHDVAHIKHQIKILLRKYNSISIINIQKALDVKSMQLVIMAIKSLFEKNEIVYNRFGQSGFLKRDGDILFISDTSKDVPFSDSWYSENPYANIIQSLDTIINDRLLAEDLKKLDSVSCLNINQVIPTLYIETKIFLLEYLLSQDESTFTDTQKQILQHLLESFSKYIFFIEKDNIIVHTLYKNKDEETNIDFLKGSFGNYRCMDQKTHTWRDCDRKQSDYISKQIGEVKMDIQKDVQQNPYQVYAIISGDDFKIADKSKEKKGAKRSEVFRGKRCFPSFKKPDLVELAHRINLIIPDNPYSSLSIQDLKDKIELNGLLYLVKDDTTKQQLETMYYITTLSNPNICSLLKDWFIQNNLVIFE